MSLNVIHKQSRAFNEVTVDKVRCAVFKRSKDYHKLYAENQWYHNIPEELQGFVPKSFYSFNQMQGQLMLDYYPYPTLAELYTQQSDQDWVKIISRVLQIHDLFSKYEYRSVGNYLHIKDFHMQKTEDRLFQLENVAALKDVLHAERITLNGESLPNFDKEFLLHSLFDLATDHSRATIVHGDLCFSNILYDPKSDCVKLIDPRGYLLDKAHDVSIFGDSNYDFAKLLHSVEGLYDFIVQGSYTLIQTGKNAYQFHVNIHPEFEKVQMKLVAMLHNSTDDERLRFYRRFLEMLLFLTMIPLHYEDSRRQLAFYLTAIQIYSQLYA